LIDDSSGNFLPALAGGTLGAGNYSIWLQETGNAIINYEVSLTVAQVPEPSSAAFVGMAAFGLILRRRR